MLVHYDTYMYQKPFMRLKMALLGYARVSTSHQIAELKNAGVREDRVFTDIMTGNTDDREGLQRLLSRAEKDDVIICTKMDRLGRNTADMIHIVNTCHKKGVAIRFLENGFSTEGTMGTMVIQILAAVSEAERERIMERTNDGRKPHSGTTSAQTMIREGKTLKIVTEKTGISRATYFRLKKHITEITNN